MSLQTVTSVSEGSMFNVIVELTTSGTLTSELVVALLSTPGTATRDDYYIPTNNSNIFTVTFAVGSRDGTVETAMISAVEDTAVEGDHEFTVSIQSTSPPAMLGASSSVVATIMDDDRKSTLRCIHYSVYHMFFQFTVGDVMIRMEETAVSVSEDVASGRVSVCAEIAALPGELQTDLTVTLFTTNGTKAGMQ